MIPTEIKLENFLTFAGDGAGGPVAFNFDGAVLWSISGANGAGKSAVFDGITYALFGEHRGGRSQDGRLVRKGTSRAAVTFQFRHGERLCQVRRTISAKTTRRGEIRYSNDVQAAEWDDEAQAWRTVPDTDKEEGLSRWIRDRVRMSADAFCSTVLLQQGSADRLLTAKPNARFDILAGLIDLSAYQTLERAAGERRRVADTGARLIDAQLAGIATVSEPEFEAAASELAEVKILLREAEKRRDDRRIATRDAQSHATLAGQSSELQSQLSELSQILDRREEIEADHWEQVTLASALEPVTAATATIAVALQAERKAGDARHQISEIDLDKARDSAATAEVRALEADQQRDATVAALQILTTCVPIADRLARARLVHADRAEAVASHGTVATWTTRSKAATTALETMAKDTEVAQAAHNDAVAFQAKVSESLRATTDELETRRTVTAGGTCSRCGQLVDAEHLAREIADLERQLAEDRASLEQAKTTLQSCKVNLTTAASNEAQARTDAEDARLGIDRAIANAGELERATTEAAEAESSASDLPADWMTPLADPTDAASFMSERKAEQQRLTRSLRRHREVADEARRVLAEAHQNREQTEARLQTLHAAAAAEDAAAVAARREAKLQLKGVDAALADPVLAGDAGVAKKLQARIDQLAPIEELWAHLALALEAKSDLEAKINVITAQIDSIPEAHRVSVEEATDALTIADAAAARARQALEQATERQAELSRRKLETERLTESLAKSRREERVARRLEALLGRSGIQAALLREATETIEELANTTLARVSMGQLSLDLQCGDEAGTGKLDMMVTDRSSADEPFEVSFISGSQRFRVAVALAAGLGQYLGGADATRALIIDEGFGSLDELGRQGMIEELHNLADQLDRVIVVSHQQDFSDPTLFPNGFHLEKVGRQTEVTRVV